MKTKIQNFLYFIISAIGLFLLKAIGCPDSIIISLSILYGFYSISDKL